MDGYEIPTNLIEFEIAKFDSNLRKYIIFTIMFAMTIHIIYHIINQII